METKDYRAASAALLQDIKDVAMENNITHEQIAERSGLCRGNVTRMLNGKYPPNLINLLKILDAIGLELNII